MGHFNGKMVKCWNATFILNIFTGKVLSFRRRNDKMEMEQTKCIQIHTKFHDIKCIFICIVCFILIWRMDGVLSFIYLFASRLVHTQKKKEIACVSELGKGYLFTVSLSKC